MGHSNINIATLIGSRICHDLISPIGAINNGLELLGMGGDNSGAEMGLIQDSVGNASARIRFFRIAFGAAGDQMMGRGEVVSILQDLLAAGRLDVAWGPIDPQPRRCVRMAFLAIQCLETAMPYGGRVEISEDAGRWTLHGRAEKLNIEGGLWSILTTQNPPSDLKPAHVQFALLPQIAADAQRGVKTEHTDTEAKIFF